MKNLRMRRGQMKWYMLRHGEFLRDILEGEMRKKR